MRKFYYISSLVFVFLIPVLVESYFILVRIDLFQLITFVMGITIIGSMWDIWATKHGQKDSVWLWQFNHKDTLGLFIFDLPIEEFLFYIITSIYIIFTWECLGFLFEPGGDIMLVILPILTVWSLLFIALPYIIRPKDDSIK